MSWTIWWDMHRHPGTEGWNRAMEKTEEEALQRAERFLMPAQRANPRGLSADLRRGDPLLGERSQGLEQLGKVR